MGEAAVNEEENILTEDLVTPSSESLKNTFDRYFKVTALRSSLEEKLEATKSEQSKIVADIVASHGKSAFEVSGETIIPIKRGGKWFFKKALGQQKKLIKVE